MTNLTRISFFCGGAWAIGENSAHRTHQAVVGLREDCRGIGGPWPLLNRIGDVGCSCVVFGKMMRNL